MSLEQRKRYAFFAILLIANAVGMILELAASRVISPYYGTSNYVWTAIIGIILLSGSVGNLAGGRLSKSDRRRTYLIYLLALAAVFVALIPVAGPVALTALKRTGLNIRVASVAASVLLFFIPSAILGVITPVVMNDMLSRREDVGLESGKIHAVIAVGSLLGTFAGGFWLIPVMGTKRILDVLAAVLLALTLLLFHDWDRRSAAAAAACTAAVIACAVGVSLTDRNADTTVRSTLEDGVSIDTQYGRILIQDGYYYGEPVRFYRQSGAYSSATFLDEDRKYEIVYDYVKTYDRMFDFLDVKDTLMIGGAAYQYPKYYISHFPDKSMDVVEIDGEATRIAKEYFYLDDLISDYQTEETGRLNLITDDGRVFLSDTDKRYDAVLNDAFSGENPVGTLATVEAARLIHDRLNPGGVYLSNVLGAVRGQQGGRFIRSEIDTLKQVFRNVYVIPCTPGTDGWQRGNYMVIASDAELNVPDQLLYQPFDTDVVLTDDYNPIDQLVTNYFD